MQLASVLALKQELADSRTMATTVAAVRKKAAKTTTTHLHTGAPPSPLRLGLGIGPGKADNDFTLGVRIFAPKSAQTERLAADIETQTHGECSIRVVPKIHARAWRPQGLQRRHRPLMSGVSIGHLNDQMAGTLGAIVEDHDGYYVLSNNHVLADTNRSKLNDPIIQQGLLDLGREAQVDDIVGTLTRFQPISFARANSIDAAIARLEDDVEFWTGWHPAVDARLSGQKKVTARDASRGLEVLKIGRTTALTRGRVTLVGLDGLRVDMGDPGRRQYATFDDQIEITGTGRRPFSDGGDSGSLILDAKRGAPIGLLFAGGEDSDGVDATYANPIHTVLEMMKVRLTR